MSDEKKELIVLNEKSVMQAFSENGGLDPIVAELKKTAELEAAKHDPSTPAGRKGLISVAASTRKGSTALDCIRKNLCAEWVAKKKAVDTNWRAVKEQISSIAEDIRKPVTDFEKAEEAKQEKIKTSLDYLENLPRREVAGVLLSAEQLKQKLTEAEAFEVNVEEFGEFAETAQAMLDNAVKNLSGFHAEKLNSEIREKEHAEYHAQKERDKKETDLVISLMTEIDNHSLTESQDGRKYHSNGIQSNIDFLKNTLIKIDSLTLSDDNKKTLKMKVSICIETLTFAIARVKEEEKAEENEKIEIDRKRLILEKIESFKASANQTVEMCTQPALLKAKILAIDSFVISEDEYEEFTDRAKVTAMECKALIQAAYDDAIKKELEAKEALEKEQAKQKMKDEKEKQQIEEDRILNINARIEELKAFAPEQINYTDAREIARDMTTLNNVNFDEFDEFSDHTKMVVKIALDACDDAKKRIENKAREEDQAHREKLIKESADMVGNLDPTSNEQLIEFIIDGKIPNISFKF